MGKMKGEKRTYFLKKGRGITDVLVKNILYKEGGTKKIKIFFKRK